jgi:hypothetical protein
MSKTPDEIRQTAEDACAAARRGNFASLFGLSDAEHEYIRVELPVFAPATCLICSI